MEEERRQTMEEALRGEIGKADGHWREIDTAISAFTEQTGFLKDDDKLLAHIEMARGMIVPAIEMQRKVLEYMASVIDLTQEAGLARMKAARLEVDDDRKSGFEKGLAEGRKKGFEEMDKYVKEQYDGYYKLMQWAQAHGWKDSKAAKKDMEGQSEATKAKKESGG